MTGATLLLRQIHPAFIKLGRVTSQAFRPTPKDENRLSVYNGDLIQPQAAWEHYHARNLESVGVLAVTVAECAQEDLPARPSPEIFPEHAEIDFTGCSANQCEKKSKKLRVVAETRGWLYQAD
jgi:hypothetical protein